MMRPLPSRPTALIAISLAIVLVVALALLRHRASALEMRLAQTRAGRDRADQELHHLRARLAVLPQSSPSIAPQPEVSDEGSWRAAAAARRRTILQAWFDLSYGRFLKTTDLTAGQKERFEVAVVEHWVRWAEVVDVAQEAHLTQSDPAFPALWKSEDAEFKADEQSALGPAAFGAWQQYQRTAAAQPVADAVAGMVFDSGQPLTAEQASAVAQIVATNSARYKTGGWADIDDVDLPAVLNQAQRILSPVQLAALQTTLSASPAIKQFTKLINAAPAARP